MRPRATLRSARLMLVVLLAAVIAPAVPAAAARDGRSAPKSPWTDVPTTYWAYQAINLVGQTNTWMQDYGPKTFKPDTVETREYAARAIVEEFHPDTKPNPKLTFPDLPSSDPFYSYANIAVQEGWMLTVSGKFRPTDPITTKELHRALVEALGYGDIADGINKIHTTDGYVFKHQYGLGQLMVGMFLLLRYNHSDESLDVGPQTPLPRSEVAWSLSRAYQVETNETWRHSQLLPYRNIHLGPIPPSFRQVVEFGLDYVGYPYVYAGEWASKSPPGYCCGYQPRGGFDCSGLTWWLMKAPANGWDNTKVRPYHGWTLLERSSTDMANAIPKKQRLTYKQAHAGDLMFYDGSGDGVIDHVDTYLGWGWALDSSNYMGGVTIQPISTGWYHDHFMWARRIIPAS